MSNRTRAFVAVGGPLALAAACLLPPPPGLSLQGWRAAGAAILMASWWLTEAIPLPATALLPLVLFPPLGIATIDEAAAPYANPVIFLFLGGFMLAGAFARSGLHRRIALAIVAAAGSSPAGLVGGFMAATAFLSMWVSNTATVMMVLPIALSVLALEDAADPAVATPDPAASRFPVALLLGIAYAANIGGMGTLVGTPPNALLAGFLDQTYGVRVGFASWMALGVPVVVVGVPVAWALLTRGLGDAGGPEEGAVRAARAALPPPDRRETIVGAVATLTAVAWITRPFLERFVPGLTDAGIAIAGALSLFLLTALSGRREPLITWEDVERVPWGVLVLVGGGLSLAASIQGTGLAAWIGEAFEGAEGLPGVAVIALVAAVIVYLTELASNTATAATFLPVAAAVAVGLGIDPLPLAAAVVLAASAAFMLPVATPPNAIVYGSGRVPSGAMARAGFLLNLAFIVLITGAVRLLGRFLA